MAESINFYQADTAVSALDHRTVSSLMSKPFASGTNNATRIDTEGGVLHQPSGGTVSQRGAGANMSVDVTRLTAMLPGILAVNQGNYVYNSDSTQNKTVTTAHATLYRKDAVVARFKDAAHGGDGTFGIFVVAGNTGASAGAATPPSDATIGGTFVVLAYITVRPATTSILDSDIEDRRHYLTAPGGIQVVRSFEVGNVGLDGWYRDNAGVLERYVASASAWAPVRGTLLSVQQNTAGSTSAGAFTATLDSGAVTCSGTFVAPASGKVNVHNSAQVGNSNTANLAICSIEVRAGSTVGSGTIIQGADIANGVYSGNTIRATSVTPVSGLTPGTVYNIQQLFVNTGTTGTFSNKRLLVEAA